jgi:hypothetical protein
VFLNLQPPTFLPAAAMDVDLPPEKKPRVEGDGPSLKEQLTEQTFVLQNTWVSGGTLSPPNRIILKGNNKVQVNDGPEHGEWFLIGNDSLSLAWHWQGHAWARTQVYRRIPGTKTWLQADGRASWQVVMVPYEPS